MKRHLFILAVSTAALTAFGAEPDPVATASEQAAREFRQRLETATQDLTTVQQTVSREKQPLLDAIQAAEAQLSRATGELARLEAQRAQFEEKRQRLQRDDFALQKNFGYLNSVARDSLRSLGDGLLPGEARTWGDRADALVQRLEAPAKTPDASAALEAVELMTQRLRLQLGGYRADGESLVGEDNRMVRGTFVYVGPEAFFQTEDRRAAGTVRMREGSTFPVTYPLPGWSSKRAAPLFAGATGTILADASGGKALRLRETNGTLFEHIDRGGAVAYLIIAVGLFALVIATQKALELRRLQVDAPSAVQAALATILRGAPEEVRRCLDRLKPSTRELFETGLRHLGKPKDVIEEHLFAFTLRQRLHFERRLPLLAVIATASPLMGLLGTVMGMIKTFALITVFGTGNAAKLSSGISEVLVTTELGLVVAVPALVLHGFLSHRTQRKLSLLERYAVEFVAEAADVEQPVPAE